MTLGIDSRDPIAEEIEREAERIDLSQRANARDEVPGRQPDDPFYAKRDEPRSDDAPPQPKRRRGLRHGNCGGLEFSR